MEASFWVLVYWERIFMNKKAIAAIVATSVIVGTVGCGSSNISGEVQQGAYEDEIITTTPVNQDKTMITVRVEVTTGQDKSLRTCLRRSFQMWILC
jgi:hypothetical protein